MSQSTLSDSLSQGQGPESNGDAALQQVVTERNSLRAQNDQLWKIIEKQRIIIQNLQKDVAKATTERDLLRHLAVENGLQLNGQPIQSSSKRSMERKPQSQQQQQQPHSRHAQHQQDSDAVSITSEASVGHPERETQQISVPLHSSSVSSSASIDSRRSLDHQHPQSPVKSRQESGSKLQLNSGESEVHTETASETEVQLSVAKDDDSASQASYDPEVQVATSASRVHHQGSTSTPPPHDIEIRSSPLRTEFSSGTCLPVCALVPFFFFATRAFLTSNESNLSKYVANLTPLSSPTAGRNISAPISLAHMPHLPPRSPRRERREHDSTSSPTASDNEDESYPQGFRRKGTTSGPISIPARFASHTQGSDDQDSQVMSVSKVSMKQANAYEQQVASGEHEYSQAKASLVTRKAVSAQIPIIPAQIPIIPATLSPQSTSQELNVPSSPVTSLNAAASPASPIAAIIDQDAEKFRVYMNKLNAPRKMASAPIQVISDTSDHASALGQAVALENIQNQIEIQNQLMGQVQGT